MNAYSEQVQKEESHSIASGVFQLRNRKEPKRLISDKRPAASVQRKLQSLAVDYSKNQHRPIQKKANHTAMPDSLKSGIEQLSGYAMDDVKVHYNSSKPAQLHAHAFAQGTDIHLAAGQEKHLPHEAWHVVQQKQRRVKPNKEIKGARINDNAALEREADVMGKKAMSTSVSQRKSQALRASKNEHRDIIQGKFVLEGDENLLEYLRKHRVENPSDWFQSAVKPRLGSIRYGLAVFMGWLKSEKPEYTLSIGINMDTPIDEAATKLAQAILGYRLSLAKSKRGIGGIRVVERSGFPAYVSAAFTSAKAELESKTGLPSKSLHLRHFVMGSWIRALPDLIIKHTDFGRDAREIAKNTERLTELTQRAITLLEIGLGFSGGHTGVPVKAASGAGAGAGSAMSSSSMSGLARSLGYLTKLLHDLPHNLNVGEGPENVIIGLASHGFSNLAFSIRKDKLALEVSTVGDTVREIITQVSFVEEGDKAEFLKAHLGTMLASVPHEGLLTPHEGYEFFQHLAFNLGMDFMKHNVGRAAALAEGPSAATIHELQAILLPLGNKLNHFIMWASFHELSMIDIEKLFHAITTLAEFVSKHPIRSSKK